jgi:hypothetical protein
VDRHAHGIRPTRPCTLPAWLVRPVEFWSEDDPKEPEPFDIAQANRHLANLNSTDDEGG